MEWPTVLLDALEGVSWKKGATGVKRYAVRRRNLPTLAIFALLAMSSVGNAQTVSDEVRCVMVSNALATGSKDPRGRQIGASVGAYFMGRLDARQPAQVKAALARQKRRVVASEAVASMNACAARAGRAEAQLRALAK
jgi:hypothetical protein